MRWLPLARAALYYQHQHQYQYHLYQYGTRLLVLVLELLSCVGLLLHSSGVALYYNCAGIRK
jgi:hypothetical protein